MLLNKVVNLNDMKKIKFYFQKSIDMKRNTEDTNERPIGNEEDYTTACRGSDQEEI